MAKNTDMVATLKVKTDKWEEGLKKSGKSMDDFKGKVEGNSLSLKAGISMLAKYAASAAALSSAMKVAKDAFNRSETAIDAWGETLEMGKSAYTTFLDTLNGGDWTNFFDNLTTAMNSAKELYGILDRMNSIEANNQYAIFKEQANLKALRYEKSKSTDPARIAQIDKEAELSIKRLEGLLTQVTESKYDAAKGMASNTIESLYNSVAGAQISKEEAARIAESVIEGAQNARDAWAKEYKRLTEKGMTEKSFIYSSGGNWGGSSTESKGQFFDINKLNKEEQHIYRLAYAITQGETALQEAAAMFTTAAQSRQGMNTQLLEASEILRMQTKAGKGGGSSWMGGAIADRTLGMGVGSIGTMTIGKLQPTDDALKNFEEWVLANPPIMPVDVIQPTQAAMEHFAQWVKDNPPAPLEIPVVVDPLKELKTTAEGIAGAFGAASGAISQFASESEAAAAIAKSFTIASAVATLVAQFAAIPKGAEIWSWIAGTIAGVGTLAGAVSTLKGFGYADGGVVKGNHFAGDAVPIMANAGEIVLNASQQQALASNLSQGGGGGGTMTLEIRGDKLVGAINNYGRGHGLGKVVFQ